MFNLDADSKLDGKVSSDKTIVLWQNDVPFDANVASSSDEHRRHLHVHHGTYREPGGLGELFLHHVYKTTGDLVADVIDEVDATARCSLNAYRADNAADADWDYDDPKETMRKYARTCRRDTRVDRLSTTVETEWLDERQHAAKISDHIRGWGLDQKYLFTVELTDTTMTCTSTSRVYKAEFSAPTPQRPIPVVTFSVFFTVETTSMVSLVHAYARYQFETDRRVYPMGRGDQRPFNKDRFERLFRIKRDAFARVNRYPGWSSSNAA